MRAILLLLTLFSVSCSTTAQGLQPDPNYVSAVATINNVAVARAAAEGVKHQALPDAIQACSKFASELSQAICALAVTGNLGQGIGGGGIQNAALSLPAPPAPYHPKEWWEAIILAPTALFEAATKIAPAWAQYLLGKATVQSQERIAIAQTEERQALYGSFATMNGQSMGANRDIAVAGFQTIGLIPQGSTTSYTVSGGTGINLGPGDLTYTTTTTTNSHNPNCTVTASGETPTATNSGC